MPSAENSLYQYLLLIGQNVSFCGRAVHSVENITNQKLPFDEYEQEHGTVVCSAAFIRTVIIQSSLPMPVGERLRLTSGELELTDAAHGCFPTVYVRVQLKWVLAHFSRRFSQK